MAETALVITGIVGRNGFDSPIEVPEDQCVEALNVDLFEGELANKRGGSTAIGVTFSSGGPFVGALGSLIRHVPGADETAAELWAADTGATQLCRLAGAATWTAPTIALNYGAAADALNVTGASLNGMLTLCYNSSENRLNVWDPSLTKVRRVGLATPAAPTTAAMGAGGLSFTRSYRVRWVDISGSDTRRRSEAGATDTETIASKLGVTVTQPTVASENETHWEVEYADTTAGPWYRAAQVAIGTTTYDDTDATVDTSKPLSPDDGINYPPPSAKFVVADGNRLILGGAWETSGGYVTPKSNRVWYTPVLGSDDIGDSERIPSGNFRDIEEAITGISQPLLGSFYVFSYRGIWKFVPTGEVTAPYQVFNINRGIGCVRHQSIVSAEDENGNPAVYFLSARGPYRLGAMGLQYLGTDIEDLWVTFNPAASNTTCFAVHHAAKHQVWFWIATGSAVRPDLRLVFDTQLGKTVTGGAVRKGWTKHDGSSATGYCGCLFANTIGASMSRDLKPHLGQISAATIWKCDSSATNDAGTNFQAYVQTKEYAPFGLGRNGLLREPSLIAQVASGVTITVTGRQDFGARTDASGTCLLTAVGSETHKQVKAEGFQSAQLGTIAYRIGDSAAASNQWTLDALYAPMETGGKR